MSDKFDEKFDNSGEGTITDDNYIDPYSGNEDDSLPIIGNQDDELTEEDIANEEKGDPEDNEYIPILDRNAPFTEEEQELINKAKQLRTIKGLAILAGILWLS